MEFPVEPEESCGFRVQTAEAGIMAVAIPTLNEVFEDEALSSLYDSTQS